MVGNSARRRIARNAFDVLGVVLLFAALLTALYYWDPTRVLVKRLLAADDGLYETVDPQFRNQNPTVLIRVHDAAALAETRRQVVAAIWGEAGLPADAPPDQVVRDLDKRPQNRENCPSGPRAALGRKLHCEVQNYTGWANLAGIDELRTVFRSPAIASEYVASVAYFRPLRANGTLVVYQHGFAGTYHDQHRHLQRLIAEGFTVAAANLPTYGDNDCPTKAQEPWCEIAGGNFAVPLPLRVHFTPLVTAISWARRDGTIHDVAAIGFSGGAWVAATLAAADTRVRASYPVAGVMPVHLRRGDKEWPAHQTYPPLNKVASLLDLFVLGTGGHGRRQVQIFNRYDRCCYNGTRPRLYEQAVQRAVRESGGGAFAVLIDESHARHKVSRWALEHIVDDLATSGGKR